MSSSYNDHQQAAAPPQAEGHLAAYSAPPPAGYPVKDGEMMSTGHDAPVETQTRGDGFWKGCCAALCCCCALDICL